MSHKIEKFTDGYAILGDSTNPEIQDLVLELLKDKVPLIVTDPPYGNIVKEKWDKVNTDDVQFSNWLSEWTINWSNKCLIPGGAFYVWGGIGKPHFRPFLRYLFEVESKSNLQLANLITWSKKRAYGVNNNYLFTREECAYFVNGDVRYPKCFNIPLLDVKRGYSGYNSDYPAKSEYYRRTNVWTDINEIFKGKLHPTQKKQKVIEIPIEVHTNLGDWVIDPFAGAGTTAYACRELGRKFVIIENQKEYYDDLVERLRVNEPTT